VWPLLRFKLGELFDTRPGGGAPFAERFLEAAHYVDLSQRMLAHLSPDLLVVMNELNVLGRTAVLVARSKGVRSLHVQHGIMADRMLWGKLHADQIAVWGEADHRRLICTGVPSERITVTGNPRFDHLAQPTSSETVKALLSSLGLQADCPIILVTTQHDSLEASRQQLSAVIQAAAGLPQHQIVVKLHPAEAFDPYRRMLRELEASHLHLVRDVDLFTLLEASAVLITRFSTTGLEAMLIGKPVISLNFSGQPDRVPYAESGAALGVHQPEELLPALEAVLTHPETLAEMRRQQECFIREYAFRVDGQAAHRVADLMNEVVAG
jgi:UDP-N-acetylglucosamine 2-epimerase